MNTTGECSARVPAAADMDVDVDITILPRPTRADEDAVLAILRDFTRGMVGYIDNHDLVIVIRDRVTGTIRGGLVAQSRWGEMHIDMLAVSPHLRGRGMGRRLIDMAEREARRRGCAHMWLDTYAFQARAFYEKVGFEVFGQLDGPPPFFPRYFMRRLLSAPDGR
ncbi:GNAT family N-acetyltransferase [Komagataeibacter diospyri]|uniref:Acetyltransferase n=1 Tax=Komagataeibacter diospyri TaxID=1932662 RepID=A0A4P5NXR6_9PROT|nr:GNAT family N-acetyltransferase [Komagataeibacter diospyri]GCE82716.1 acetyltransferase [Komagataeibacter diospyri]